MWKLLACSTFALSFGTAVSAATLTLDADSAATGANLQTTPLVTALGTISFDGEVRSTSDPELAAAGSVGNVFDIFDSATGPVTLSFDFDVSSITFIYGGNVGGITVSALDALGGVIDTFTQADTNFGQPAGPETLMGTGIRALQWNDTESGRFAALDNISISTDVAPVPVPAALPLLGGGLLALFGFKRRQRKT